MLAEGLTDATDEWGIAQVQPDDRADAGNISNAGGLMASMWTNPGTTPAPYDWQPTVMLHEITHNLGGVQQSAPHHTSGWHCTDGEDVMCYPDGTPEAASYNSSVCPLAAGAIPQTYDCGHDDYFNPDPAVGSYLDTHWNVYTSAFMGACAKLAPACGDNIVPTVPVNTALPTVDGPTQPGAVLTASFGTWLNRPTTYALQWQRAAGADWAQRPGRGRPQLPGQPRRRGRRAAGGRHGEQRRRLRDRRLGPDGPGRGDRCRSSPTPKPAAPPGCASGCATTRATPRARWRRPSSPSAPGARCARNRRRSPSPPEPGACACAPAPRRRTCAARCPSACARARATSACPRTNVLVPLPEAAPCG